jgi:hypothetical protein
MKRFLACALLLGGCQKLTEVVVRVDSTIAPGSEFNTKDGSSGTFSAVCLNLLPGFGTAVQASPSSSEEVVLETSTMLTSGSCLPIELGVVAKDDWSGLPFAIEVRGSASCAEADNYLYARAETQFVDGKTTLLTVTLDPACSVDESIGPSCAADQNERCVVTGGCAEITPDTPAAYVAPTRTCPSPSP